jgi:phosphoglycolate phosphatase
VGTIRDYDTYIFDLDGTLLDTLGDLAASVNYALQRFGLPQHSRDEVRRMVGNGVRILMERAVAGGSQHPLFAAAFDTFRQHYMEHSLDTTCPYEGITEMLTELKKQGKHTAVVSNKFDAATKSLCTHFFPDTVDVAVGEHEAEGIRKKPAPDTVLEALSRMGVGSERAVYVGDSEVDIATARNSGLPCISVLWGFRDRQFLLSHGATCFISSPRELLLL